MSIVLDLNDTPYPSLTCANQSGSLDGGPGPGPQPVVDPTEPAIPVPTGDPAATGSDTGTVARTGGTRTVYS